MPVIKWAPHNLVRYSEDFSGLGWTAQSGTTVTSNQAVAPDGTLTADLVVGSGTSGLFWSSAGVPADSNNTKAVWLKGVSGGETVRLQDPAQTVGTTTCNLTTEWQLFSLTEIQSNGLAGIWVRDIPAGGIYIWGAHLYRSDLGGMVDNPDRGDSYVPTASRPFGPELVTNGAFDSDSDWTKGTGWSISGGVAVAEGSTSDGRYLEQDINLVSGKTYSYEINVSGNLTGSNYLSFRFGGSSDDFTITSGSGLIRGNVTASGSGNLRIRSEASLTDITIDNISSHGNPQSTQQSSTLSPPTWASRLQWRCLGK